MAFLSCHSFSASVFVRFVQLCCFFPGLALAAASPPVPLSPDEAQEIRFQMQIHQIASQNDLARLKNLLHNGLNPDRLTWPGTLLMLMLSRERPQMAKFLVRQGADVNALSVDGRRRTPLMYAATGNLPGMVRYLVRQGARVDAVDADGRSALIHAVRLGLPEVVEALLKKGASTAILDNEGRTALMYAAMRPHDRRASERRNLQRFLFQAPPSTNTRRLLALLLKNGAQLDQRDLYGRTALAYAVEKGALQSVRFLLKAGADPNEADDGGVTPLMLAASLGILDDDHPRDKIKLLLRHGAYVNLVDHDGRTPLMFAAQHKLSKTAGLLMDHGAEPDFQDSDGMTALMYASETTDMAIATTLLQRGASLEPIDHQGVSTLFYLRRAYSSDEVKRLLLVARP